MTFQKIGNLFMEEKKVLILWISVIVAKFFQNRVYIKEVIAFDSKKIRIIAFFSSFFKLKWC